MKCVICQRREVDGQVCRSCPPWLDGVLVEIVELYALAPSAVIPTRGGGPKVSGSREAPVPARLDVVDLLTQARQPNPTEQAREYPEDQTGHLSVATALDQWVRDWISYDWCRGDHLPVPTVYTLVGWLRVRLEDACDHHPAIDEFATEVRQVRAILNGALGRTRHVDRLPAPCPTCELTSLQRQSGAGYVECDSCGRLWTEDEYRRLCVVLAAEQEVA